MLVPQLLTTTHNFLNLELGKPISRCIMGSMMTKQRTADYALHFATLAVQIAREADLDRLKEWASILIEDAGFIEALAQGEAFLTEDP